MATMTSGATVYYGPSNSLYPVVGSVSSGETIDVFWKDGSWYFIQYTIDGTTTKKRGYISSAAFSGAGTIPTFSSVISNAGTRYVNTSGNTYCGPASSGYYQAGSVDRGEAVTYLGYKYNNYAFIEYDISGGKKKRAFFYANYLGTAPVIGTVQDMVDIALTQLGTDGGEPYWSWYGYSSRVLWCACFVSWCGATCS